MKQRFGPRRIRGALMNGMAKWRRFRRAFGGGYSNICLETVGVSGTVIGFHTGLGIGTVNPTHTADGTLFYGCTWDYPAVTGKFLIQWGDAGDEQLTDVSRILMKSKNGVEVGIAIWNDTDKAYVFTNLENAQQLNDAYDANEIEPFCFSMLVLPSPFIRITYNQLLRGA